MKNFSPINSIPDTEERLLKANISLYKIAKIIAEPKATVKKIFNPVKYKYSEEKVSTILRKINQHLDELEGKKIEENLEAVISENSAHPEMLIKLYRLGLNSKSFTPEEKLKLALAHKKLKDSQIKT